MLMLCYETSIVCKYYMYSNFWMWFCYMFFLYYDYYFSFPHLWKYVWHPIRRACRSNCRVSEKHSFGFLFVHVANNTVTDIQRGWKKKGSNPIAKGCSKESDSVLYLHSLEKAVRDIKLIYYRAVFTNRPSCPNVRRQWFDIAVVSGHPYGRLSEITR